jgi:enoyl-CoA hydratase
MTEPAPSVRVERSGPVTTVVLSRPERRNAVDGPTASALTEAFRDFDADDSTSVAVLYGAGGTFCAGADLHAFGTDRQNRIGPDGDGPMGPTRMRLSKPVVAAVSGYAVAGGLELALPRLIGTSRAMDLVLTGREVHADEALAIGLANRVVPDGTARAQAEALAATLAALPQTCLRQDRLSLLEQHGLGEADALSAELRHGLVSLAEAADGVRHFTEGAGRHGGAVD